MKRTMAALIVAMGILTMDIVTLQAADTFSFAGFTFNQLNSPQTATLLGTNEVLDGAAFSAGFANTVTAVINFPGGTGFNSAHCLGPLTGLSASSVRAVNLPRGNDGTLARHGIEVAWTNRALPNLDGADFVIYESGSTSNAVEGIMVRAHTLTNDWTDWYYFAPTNFQITTSPEVLFADSFDLSSMGVPADAFIDRIQLANLMPPDRIVTTNTFDSGGGVLVGQGKVVFDSSTSVLPDAGIFDADRKYDPSTYDPDPLYVAVLHDVCETVAPTLSLIPAGNSVTLEWPAPSCYTLQSVTTLPSTNASWEYVPEITFVTNGQYAVTATVTNTQRFFRLYKP